MLLDVCSDDPAAVACHFPNGIRCAAVSGHSVWKVFYDVRRLLGLRHQAGGGNESTSSKLELERDSVLIVSETGNWPQYPSAAQITCEAKTELFLLQQRHCNCGRASRCPNTMLRRSIEESAEGHAGPPEPGSDRLCVGRADAGPT